MQGLIFLEGGACFFNLFTLFSGTIIYRYLHRQLSSYGISLLLIIVVCFNVFWGDIDPSSLSTHSFISMQSTKGFQFDGVPWGN